MIYLLDANILIRFLIGDHEEYLAKSIAIFKDIESSKIQAEILESVLMEVYFVLTKFYKISKLEVIRDLKAILNFNAIVNSDKVILFETLNILENKNIDFVDALLCSKRKLQGYSVLSFDEDLKKC